MNQREVVALVRSVFSGSGYISSSDKSPARRVLFMIKNAISTIQKRRLDNKKDFSVHDIVALPCVRLEEADKVSCPGIPPEGTIWMKSVEAIPRFIKVIDIIDLQGNVSIPILSWTKLKSKLNSRFSKLRDSAAATFRTEADKTYLYIIKSSLRAVSMDIVPEDYAEAILFPKCGEVNKKLMCNLWDIDIGVDASTVEQAVKLISPQEILAAKVKSDEVNNSSSII